MSDPTFSAPQDDLLDAVYERSRRHTNRQRLVIGAAVAALLLLFIVIPALGGGGGDSTDVETASGSTPSSIPALAQPTTTLATTPIKTVPVVSSTSSTTTPKVTTTTDLPATTATTKAPTTSTTSKTVTTASTAPATVATTTPTTAPPVATTIPPAEPRQAQWTLVGVSPDDMSVTVSYTLPDACHTFVGASAQPTPEAVRIVVQLSFQPGVECSLTPSTGEVTVPVGAPIAGRPIIA
ncbi:MAG: hypothetical protein KAZ88_05175 [Acidimicrobiia bacterium]|jgi:hypothetical protein|nr:hypothetical protein [Acidimicrobiia bacterium]MBP8180363.1 hypothetical protein [Acidimicrobiia bacterium]